MSKKFIVGSALMLVLGIIVFVDQQNEEIEKFFGQVIDTTEQNKKEQEQKVIEKQDFLIELRNVDIFNKKSFIEKIGKVVSGTDITLKSQAHGKVSMIHVKEGRNVAKGQKIISLTDSISSYGLNLEKANLGVESAKINYDSQKIMLDKAVDDAELNLEKVKNNYNATLQILSQNLAQSQLQLSSSKNSDKDTTFLLQVQKVKNNYKKAELDIKNLKNAHQQKFQTFKHSAITNYDALDNISTDIIDFTDRILGMTPLNKRLNDKFEDYLGKKDSVQFKKTKKMFTDLLVYKKESFDILNFEGLDFNTIELVEYEKIFTLGDSGYNQIKELLIELTRVLDNSIVSVGSLNQSQIDGYKTKINAFEIQIQSNKSAYLGFKSQVRTFLSTYKDSEKSAEENVKLLEDEIKILEKNKNITETDFDTVLKNNNINYKKVRIANNKSVNDLNIGLKNAKLMYENAKKVRTVTLQQRSNAIKISKNGSAQAYKELTKLHLTSPIYGTLVDVLVTEGQSVSIGSPLVKITNIQNIEVETTVSEEELFFIKRGQKITIKYSDTSIIGKVKSISSVADKNLNYKIIIELNQKFKTVGGLVNILIPIDTHNTLVPLNVIDIVGEGKGRLNIWSGSVLDEYSVDLGKVWGDKIEITSKIDNNIQVITTNLSNYDAVKFRLKERGKEEE